MRLNEVRWKVKGEMKSKEIISLYFGIESGKICVQSMRNYIAKQIEKVICITE